MGENLDITIKYDGDIRKLTQNRCNIELRRYNHTFYPDKIVWQGGYTVIIYIGRYEIPVDLSAHRKYYEIGEMKCLKLQIKPK